MRVIGNILWVIFGGSTIKLDVGHRRIHMRLYSHLNASRFSVL